MKRIAVFFETAGLLAATTIGAGVFALPYLFARAGWATGLLYLVLLSGLVAFAHLLYARVVEKTDDKSHLIGLARRYLGRTAFAFACLAIVGGLLLSLVAYLVLAGTFLGLLTGSVRWWVLVLLFWLAASFPLFVRLRSLVDAELVGTIFMTAIIVALFATTTNLRGAFAGPSFDALHLTEPFGAVLFSLAAWTAVPAMVAFARKARMSSAALRAPIVFGTFFSAALYALFVFGILGSNLYPAPDTVSDLRGLPPLFVSLIAVLGVFAVWTSYVPIALEMKESLEADLRLPPRVTGAFTLFVPPVLLLLGANNFSAVVGFAGGVFLAAQYALLMLVARRALKPVGFRRAVLDVVILAFALAALYSVAHYFQ